MNKIEIEVPRDIRYISEWTDFNTDLLKGHCIINKTITGCGFTHYSLTNNIPTILCSPRKFLLENKFEQLKDTYLVVNSKELSINVDDDTKGTSSNQLDNSFDFENIQKIQSDLSIYLLECQLNSQVPKILVTYDSLKHVLSTIGLSNLINYSIIVDEFQNIFMDSSFKAEVELNFIDVLQSCPNVTYLSATPFIEEYLDELDEFKNLPYYELRWDPCRLRKIGITLKKTSTPNREVDKIIQNYLSGNFPSKYIDGIYHESKEVVFYVNSVRMIKNTIKRNNLTPDQVNIICADTPKNKKELTSIGHSIGKAPLKGEPHKMFTFCTRTTYVGADFYSTCAWSIIISDCAIDSLSTDIRMDFPQIMGRQRLKENVFRDECTFIFRLSDKEVTSERFEEISKKKLEKSRRDIDRFNQTIQLSSEHVSDYLQDIRSRILDYKYSGDYTGIQTRTGSLVINKLVYLSERRAFELRSNTYKSEVSVYDEFSDLSGIEVSPELGQELDSELKDLNVSLSGYGSFEIKMRLACEFLEKYSGYISIYDIKSLKMNLRNYILSLGIERIRARGYHESELKKEMEILKSGDSIRNSFIESFKLGEIYSSKKAKGMIQLIYQNLGLSKSSKATDLEEYFNVENVFTYEWSGEERKRVRGFRILSIKN